MKENAPDGLPAVEGETSTPVIVQRERVDMNNVAQSAHKGPFVNGTVTGIEDAHERRINARVAKERDELAEDARVYREIANEVEGGPLSAQRLVVVLASAIGAFPGNPLTAIIEEIGRRCTTLALTARAGLSADGICPGDVLEALERELQMLETRASVAVELLRRFGDPCDTLRDDDQGEEVAPTSGTSPVQES